MADERMPDKVGENTGSGQIVHEEAARVSGRKYSWLEQLRRAFRLSKGRPYGEDRKRK